MKRSLLLVDADPRSRRLLEVSLRKAGYTVTVAESGEQALEVAASSTPDLILADTRLPGIDGFELVKKLRADTALRGLPFVFLSSDTTLQSKVRGLELGVEYLTKPIYIREVLTRVALEIERVNRKVIELRSDSATRFSGTLRDMGLVDLLQTIDVSRKSGVLLIHASRVEAKVWFKSGQVVDAEAGTLTGDRAIYRVLTWNDGSFELTFGDVDRKATVGTPTQALLMEGMRRIDEWERLLEQVPERDTVLEVDDARLLEKLGDIPDEANAMLKRFDGTRRLGDVLEATEGDELVALKSVADMYFEGVLVARGRRPSIAAQATADGFRPATEVARVPASGHPAIAPSSPEQDLLGGGTLKLRFGVADAVAQASAASAKGPSGTVIQFPRKDGAAAETKEVEPSPFIRTKSSDRPQSRDTRPDHPQQTLPEPVFSEASGGTPHGTWADEDSSSTTRDTWDDVQVPTAGPSSAAKAALAVLVALSLLGVCFYYVYQIHEERSSAARALPPRENVRVPESPLPSTPTEQPTDKAVDSPTTPPPREASAPAGDLKPVIPPAVEPASPTEAVPPTEPTGAPSYEQLLADAKELEGTRKTKEAMEAYRAAIAADPNGGEALTNLAFILLDHGKVGEATELAQRATVADPQNPKAWITLGASLQTRGRAPEAREAYSRCAALGESRYLRDCRALLR